MDDGVQAFMRAMDDGFPAVETMSAPEARAVIVGRRLPVDEPRRCGQRRRLNSWPRRRAGADLPPARGQRCAPRGGVLSRRRLRALRPRIARQLLPGDVAPHRDGRRLGGLPARAGASRACGGTGRVRRVLLGDGPRRRTRHRPGASADRRGQRGRKPRRRHRAACAASTAAPCPSGRC